MPSTANLPRRGCISARRAAEHLKGLIDAIKANPGKLKASGTAQGGIWHLGLAGMLVASLVTATIIAFLGIIGFVGLVVPHLVRRLIGADHRYLLPATVAAGALLLLVADTAARLLFMPHVLPVSVLTAFVGAPVFLWLIVKGRR